MRCITNNYKKMKQQKFLAFLCIASLAFSGCNEESGMEINPESKTTVLDFESEMWNRHIDNPQYNGPLLYGENAKNYGWQDPTTKLSGGMTNAWGGLYGFAEGGTAISNYIDEKTDEARGYDVQLSVPRSNGSKNFAIVFCNAGIEFSDGKAREIKSMDISPTTYTLSVIKNGDGYAKALTQKGDFLTIIISGLNGKEQTGKIVVTLGQDGNFQEKWFSVDLSRLGKVTRLEFTMESNDSSEYGIKTPAYFAFDNVTIEQ